MEKLFKCTKCGKVVAGSQRDDHRLLIHRNIEGYDAFKLFEEYVSTSKQTRLISK